MKLRLTSLLLVLALLVGLTGCGSSQAQQPTDAATRSFTDDCGRTLELPCEITRIVPSGPLAQMVLLALAPELFVGLSSELDEADEGYYAAEYFELPVFGQLYDSADLSVEELALASPELIIDIGEVKDSVSEDMDTLQSQTAIPTVFISATLETMPEAFRRLGELLDREEKAEQLAQFCERVYDRTLGIMEEVGAEGRAKALYILGENGHNVLAKDSYHAELIDLLTENLAVVDNPSGKGLGNEVTMEQIALWDPEFIIFAPGSVYLTAAGDSTWSELDAIANGAYVEVPEGPHNWLGTPPGIQRYLGLIWLTAALYPDYCDYDVQDEITEGYRLFYGCELSEEQYAQLTARAFAG